jgi:hypothetical protein
MTDLYGGVFRQRIFTLKSLLLSPHHVQSKHTEVLFAVLTRLTQSRIRLVANWTTHHVCPTENPSLIRGHICP